MSTHSVYGVIYTQTAQDDLEQIALFYAQTADLTVVELILGRIDSAVMTLEQMPRRCQAVQFDTKGRDIRKLSIPKTPIIAYFEIIQQMVYILKIEHGKADQRHLFEYL